MMLCEACEKLSTWTVYITQCIPEFAKDYTLDNTFDDEGVADVAVASFLHKGHRVHKVKWQGFCEEHRK